MNKIFLGVLASLLASPNAFAVADTKQPHPQADNSYYAYESPTTNAAAAISPPPARNRQEQNMVLPPEPGETLNFTDGVTSRKLGDTTYFSTGVICQGSGDIAVCS